MAEVLMLIETPAPDGWLPEYKAIDNFYDRVPHERGINLHGVFMRKKPLVAGPDDFIPWG